MESGKKIVIEVMYKTVSDPMKYWIIGSGKFGVRAAEILYQKHPSARITLVDSNPESLAGLNLPCKIVCTDGIGFLVEALESGEMPDWVVPCIPVHLAFRWLAKSLLPACHLEVLRVPESLIYQLPNPFRGPNLELYVSFADFLCPEDCPEPTERCTATGRPRKGEMFRFLAETDASPYKMVVLQSRQLAPGVGGYTPAAMFEARNRVCNSGSEILFATACRCQGVINALSISPIP
ncbi:MAG: potassium transporter [Desulfobacterales bacterium]|nr:potassium transporter [Desulfobacterales bacterium]